MNRKPFYATLMAASLLASLVAAEDINFGDDSSQYANDGECDDPRFTGEGMASSGTDAADIEKDMTDCSKLFRAGTIRLVRTKEESDISECKSIDYGDDSSEWANDNECDDPRFTGGDVHKVMLPEDLMSDATDCQKLCESGTIWLK